MKLFSIPALLLLSLAASAQSTDPPNLLSLQLRLADSLGAPLAGPVSLDLRLYDAPTAGNLLWAESQSATALDGVVAVQLGATTVLPPDLFTGGERFLGLSVEGDPEMVPRTKIASAPFARRAASVAALDAATVVPDGFVGPTAIADGAISGAKLAAGSVTSVNLAPGAVGTTALVDDAVDATKLAPGAVSSSALAAGSVLGSHIADGMVSDVDIATGAAIQGTKVVPSFGSQTVTTTGRLGVGTTSLELGADLHVKGQTTLAEIVVTPSVADSSSQLSLWENTTASLGAIQRYDGTANQWQLLGQNFDGETGPHVVVRRDDGKVGIGTTSPSVRLHVDGVTDASPSGGGGLQVGSTNDVNVVIDTNEIMARDNGGPSALILNRDGGNVQIGAGSGDDKVQLAGDSVSPAEMHAEPGVSRFHKGTTFITGTGVNVLASQTINCPASGFVVALAQVNVIGNPIDGTYRFDINTSSSFLSTSQRLETIEPNSRNVFMERTFPVSAGSQTFHFLADKLSALDLDQQMFDATLTLIYVPTAYGTVATD